MVAIWFIDYMRFTVALLCAAVRRRCANGVRLKGETGNPSEPPPPPPPMTPLFSSCLKKTRGCPSSLEIPLKLYNPLTPGLLNHTVYPCSPTDRAKARQAEQQGA
ncbi:unnamed protein product [Leuciscus chuanchicus]